MVFRACERVQGYRDRCINDLLDADYLAYMLKYDSARRFDGDVSVDNGALIVNARDSLTPSVILPT